MRKYDFKQHQIVRSNVPLKSPYSKYRQDLMKDFKGRCCYCNMFQDLITTAFHIEHFIPKKVFQGKKDYLLTHYDNLMWSCPKCNLSKSDAYVGNLMATDEIVNELFYNPVDIDYNVIFYRDELGNIASDDEKGKKMIKKLKLYRPVHKIGWLVERLEVLEQELNKKVETETDPEKKALLGEVHRKIAHEGMKYERQFRAAYNGRKFEEKE